MNERVLHIASLARINVTEGLDGADADAALARFSSRFDDIVGLMDSLSAVDTTGVEPLCQPLAFAPAPPREDVALRARTRQEILENAPEQDGAFFVVPKIVG